MESKIEHFLSNPIILSGITLNSELILFTDLGPCWEHDWIRLKVLYFGSTIHMGGVTIRKRTVIWLVWRVWREKRISDAWYLYLRFLYLHVVVLWALDIHKHFLAIIQRTYMSAITWQSPLISTSHCTHHPMPIRNVISLPPKIYSKHSTYNRRTEKWYSDQREGVRLSDLLGQL